MKPKYTFIFLLAVCSFLPACFRTHAEIEKEREEREAKNALQENVASYAESIEGIKARLGQLQGRMEEIENDRKREVSSALGARKEQEEKLDLMQKRLEVLEKSQNVFFEQIKKIAEEKSFTQSAAPLAKKSQKKNFPNTYEAGLKEFKAKHYQAAAGVFDSFLKENPRTKHFVEANYYKGEALYYQKDYAAAILSFGAVQEKSPISTMGRKATLRMAESFHALGKEKEAKTFARLLVEGSPNSEEAKKAKRFLP